MKKLFPYLYILFGLYILVEGFLQYFQDKELYLIIFSWTTESKYLFILIKILFACIFFVGGINGLKKLKE
ncbi:hypothetical protein C7447_103437 [Tenacibaculum adriaticum]|uniref:Uncharacterized protein n=1 Tax=Tenacibaculum adriaticum TaxID=413713 RepID=A0A5S5DTD7_9FLAO|nr:hypothetical protein [Tenacibaculum adriaticum]TYP98266.1 hypothetical protein C7447_103437 [Tenacibaculum adriaticum]